jgi:DNA-directed RNA polymerase specialized sigma24 family protein
MRVVEPDAALPPEVLDALPHTYARVLRLMHAGVEREEIARQLEVPPESVDLLCELARRKVNTLLEEVSRSSE